MNSKITQYQMFFLIEKIGNLSLSIIVFYYLAASPHGLINLIYESIKITVPYTLNLFNIFFLVESRSIEIFIK